MPLPSLPVIAATAGNPCVERACSACCHDIEMLLTEADLERLRAVAPPGLDFWFRAGDGYLQLRTRGGPPARGGQGRPCVFLGADGMCTVHEARPEGCRLYPAAWDEEVREAVLDADYCPHTDAFRITPEVARAVRGLAARLEEERRRRTQSGSRRRPR